MLLAIAGTASAAPGDPVVVCPEDIPGADVIVFYGDSYTFDVSQSFSPNGIMYFTIVFKDGGTPVSLWSDDGIEDYTFTFWGQTWVTVTAYDWLSSKGMGYFSIDVVELVDYDMDWLSEYRVIDHSLYLRGANLNVDGSTVVFNDGVGTTPGGSTSGVPDQLTESINPSGTALAGTWKSYYTYYYGSNYGAISEDPDTKLSGEMSIKCGPGSYGYSYGFEYWFTTPADLREFNTVTFWLRNTYGYYYNYIYLYGSGSYGSPYAYSYEYICQMASTSGWYGITYSLDFNRVGYGNNYFYSGLVNVYLIRLYIYAYTGTSWVDNMAFYKNEAYGDQITESVYPSGDLAGSWSGGYSGATTSTSAYVGAQSVQYYMPGSSYYSIAYTFNSPQDMSQFDALRMFNWWTGYYYLYWYGQFYVYFSNGGYVSYYNANMFNYYASYYYGRWYILSLPWGPNSNPYQQSNVDWTKVKSIEFTRLYTYPYAGYLRIDGMEWYGPGKAGTYDSVPLAIYNDGGDTTITNSRVQGGAKTGARILTDGGTATFKASTFDNIWATQYDGVHNAVSTYGGLEVYGDAVIDNIIFTNCKGPGLALFDGTMQMNPATIDLLGTAQKLKASPMIIVGASENAVGPLKFDVTGWSFRSSSKGSGMMVMLDGCTADTDILVHGNQVTANGGDGIIVSSWGASGDIKVKVYDQTFSDMGNNGLNLWFSAGQWSATAKTVIEITNVTVSGSGANGVQMTFGAGAQTIDVAVTDCTFNDNEAAGVAHALGGLFGDISLRYHNVSVESNGGNGMEFTAAMAPYIDMDGNAISPVMSIDGTLSSCTIKGNSANGLFEDLSALESPNGGVAPPWPWSGSTRTSLFLDLTLDTVVIIENAGAGWWTTSSDGWIDANLRADHRIVNTTIEDNRGEGVHIEPTVDVLASDAKVEDLWTFEDSFINDNRIGVYHFWGYYNPGYYSEVTLRNCKLEGAEAQAILAHGGTTSDGVREWGVAGVLGVKYLVNGCRITSPIVLELKGASDWGRSDWSAGMGIQFTDNIVDTEENVIFSLGATPDSIDFNAWGEIGNNKFYKKFMEDGVALDIYGGQNVAIDVTIRDLKISNAPGSGLDIRAGLLWSGFEQHMMSGAIKVFNVTVEKPAWNGVNLTVDNAQVIGAKTRAILQTDGLTVNGGINGIKAYEINGKIYRSTISGCSAQSVNIGYALFDFYGCDIGPITTDNILVMTKGAARIWYDVGVEVKWAGGARVVGAVVSMQDNTLATIGVSTMGANEPVPFGYVNSYTVLPDSVYSRTPYFLQTTYLGLTTEKLEDITANIIIELVLVDDILPRLTVTTPADGAAQTDRSLEVKGFAWDLHSGLDRVEVSIDGDEWFVATGTQDFVYTFASVPEGQLVLMVKAIDLAGNVRLEERAVLVDATAPLIQVIEPTLDVFSTREGNLNIIGVTEIGATVSIANTPVALELTMFTHTLSLREGPNEVRVMASDRLGNTAVHIITVTLDTIAPPLIIIEPRPNAALGKARVTVVGQTEEGAAVKINGAPVANLQGAFTGTTTLVEGANVIVVESQDAIGNVMTARVPVVIDTADPWISLVLPQTGMVYGSTGVPIDGWVEPGTLVFVNDVPFAASDGHFMGNLAGPEGAFTVSIVAVDRAGNDAARTLSVVVDLTAPTIVLDEPMDGLVTKDDYVMLVGKLVWERETFREVTFTLNGGFLPFAADGTFRERVQLGEGTNPMTLIATDDVGNAHTMTLTVMRDSTAPFLLAEPTPTFMHAVWNKPATYHALVYVEGDTEPGATVTVDGAEIDIDPSGHFNVSVQLPEILASDELVHATILVRATDAAGNSREQTIDIYRLKAEEKETGVAKYDSAQWWALVLSIIVLVLALLTVWLLLRSAERKRVLEAEASTVEGR